MSTLPGADIQNLEYPTLKVPYEVMNKNFRAVQKTLDRDIARITTVNGELDKVLKVQNKVTVKDVSKLVESLCDNLSALKRKASEGVAMETEAATVLKKRLQHLKVGADDSPENAAALDQWRKVRGDRMLVDFLLRENYYETGLKLSSVTDVDYLANTAIFTAARDIERSLTAHQTPAALEWCVENRSKLRRIKSNLELLLREQEYIEMIRRGRTLDALKYAQKYFSAIAKEHHSDHLLPLMGLLIYQPSTTIPCYRELFSDDRWEMLLREFRHENYRIFQLNSQSVFSACLQAGLSSLKTPMCYTSPLWNPFSFGSSSFGGSNTTLNGSGGGGGGISSTNISASSSLLHSLMSGVGVSSSGAIRTSSSSTSIFDNFYLGSGTPGGLTPNAGGLQSPLLDLPSVSFGVSGSGLGGGSEESSLMSTGTVNESSGGLSTMNSTGGVSSLSGSSSAPVLPPPPFITGSIHHGPVSANLPIPAPPLPAGLAMMDFSPEMLLGNLPASLASLMASAAAAAVASSSAASSMLAGSSGLVPPLGTFGPDAGAHRTTNTTGSGGSLATSTIMSTGSSQLGLASAPSAAHHRSTMPPPLLPPSMTLTTAQINRANQCPICVPEARELARRVPFAHASQSRLVCAYTGEPMNGNSSPMMLPNGMVYSRAALEQMAADSVDGMVACPRTRQRYTLSEAERIFIM